MCVYRRYKTYGDHFGLDLELVTPEEVARLNPLLDVSGLLGGLYCPTDGSVDPAGLTSSFARGARGLGATLVEGCPVQELLVDERGSIRGVKTARGTVSVRGSRRSES